MRALLIAVIVLALTGAPAAAQQDSVFAVSRSGSSLLRVNSDGRVGIGTSTPTQRLTVEGGLRADSATVSRIRFADGSTVTSTKITPAALTQFGLGFASGAGAGYAPPQYYKDVNGIVHLSGTIRFLASDTSSPATMFVLPDGYRPAGRMVFATGVPDHSVQVNADGTVQAVTYSFPIFRGDAFPMDGIQFLPAQ